MLPLLTEHTRYTKTKTGHSFMDYYIIIIRRRRRRRRRRNRRHHGSAHLSCDD
jgi:hypothetical protein